MKKIFEYLKENFPLIGGVIIGTAIVDLARPGLGFILGFLFLFVGLTINIFKK